jgi:hypothetical protein
VEDYREALEIAIKALDQMERIATEVKQEMRRMYCFAGDGLIYKGESEKV